MTEHNLCYYPYAPFTNEQLPQLKVAALYIDKLCILDPVDASWATIGVDHHARQTVNLLKDAGILQTMTPTDVLAKFAGPITDTIRRDMRDREFLDLCEARGGGHCTLSLAKVPQDLQTDPTMRHLMGGFVRRAAREAGDYRKQLSDELGLIQNQKAAQESTEAPFRIAPILSSKQVL